MIVVYKVDRLTRALSDFAKIVDILDTTGASFVSVTQAFNITTSMGRAAHDAGIYAKPIRLIRLILLTKHISDHRRQCFLRTDPRNCIIGIQVVPYPFQHALNAPEEDVRSLLVRRLWQDQPLSTMLSPQSMATKIAR